MAEHCVADAGLSLLPEACLALCSLLPRVLQAAQHLGLIAASENSTINTVSSHFVHHLIFLSGQTKQTFEDIPYVAKWRGEGIIAR